MKAIRADWICPVAGAPIADGAVLVEGSRIVEVVHSVPEEIPVDTFDGCAILPGFVNTHVHLELTILRGFLENLSFFEWIRRLTRTKYEHLNDEDLKLSAQLGALECLQAGVTTVGEVTDAGAGWWAMNEFGLRGLAYQEVFGPAETADSEAMGALRQKIESLRGTESSVCRIGVSPHAPYSVSRNLYVNVRDFARAESLPVAMHLAESRAEGDFIRTGTGPFAEYWKSRGIAVVPQAMSPVAYVDSLGMLDSETLVIHAIDSDAQDIRRLKENGVGIAHCPKSNLKLGHGIAPVREFLALDMKVGLGTDSLASNNVVDMFEEMRALAFLQRTRSGDPKTIDATTALHLATLGGAQALGMESDVGSLEPGKLADIVVVGLGDLALQPVYDPVETIVYSAGRKNVVATFLGGERVEVESSELVSRARDISTRLKRVTW